MNVAYIPVRAGSKSISEKNIKNLLGRPLVYWVVKAACDTNGIDKVVVGSDSEEYLELIKSFDLPKLETFKRGAESCTDTASTESAMLEYINAAGLSKDDQFILIQATSPLLTSEDLQNGLKMKESHDSVLSCVLNKRFFWSAEGMPQNYDYRNRPRRQDMQGAYMENGAFYINTVENILKDENRLSGDIGIVEMPEYTAVEIDEEDDWIIIESLMRRHMKIYHEIGEIKLFVSDVDGVLTDAGMYYSNDGVESKKFNTRDGKGFELLRNEGIKTAIITSEDTKAVDDRAKKLKIDFLYQGISDKVKVVEKILKEIDASWENVAYIGDDINDLPSLKLAGLSATPADGQPPNKSVAKFQCQIKGGDGCVREFADFILSHR